MTEAQAGRGRAIVDADGVFVDMAHYTYREYIAGAPIERVTHYDAFFTVAKEHDPAGYARMKEALAGSAYWRGLPPLLPVEKIALAFEVLRRRREVTIATSPYAPCATWHDDRRAWLEQHVPPPWDLFIGDDKSELDGDVLIEDKPQNALDWLDTGRSQHRYARYVVLIDHPWTRDAKVSHYRAKDLVEAAYFAYAASFRRADSRVANLERVRASAAGLCRVDRRSGSILGNPFLPDGNGGRIAAMAKYAQHFDEQIATSKAFRQEVERVRGQRLACWCAPLACHGNVVLDYHDRTASTPAPHAPLAAGGSPSQRPSRWTIE